jgi:hypothetical protein
LIYTLVEDFYTEAAGREILSGAVLVYQSFGDMMRFNSHWHGIILEGGFDLYGNFVFIPIHALDKMTEVFRRRIIRFFLDKELITEAFASNLLSWKNSGFSIDAKLRLYGSDYKTRESIAQYLVRPPLSLNKIKYEPFKNKVLFKTKYNDYFGENFKVYDGEDFIAALTKHIPPARVHLVRYYGLYSSRSRGIWKDMPYIFRLTPEGWLKRQEEQNNIKDNDVEVERQDVKGNAKRSAWARLINKVYGINPLIYNRCGSEMRIIAFVMDPEQIDRIMKHLDDHTHQDMLDTFDESGKDTGHHPSWTVEIAGVWGLVDSGNHRIWRGELEPGLYTLVFVNFTTDEVWYVAGLTVAD